MINILGNIPGIKIWINFFINVKYRLSSKKIKFGYNCEIRNSIFKGHNALGKNVSIQNSYIDNYTYISDFSTIRNTKIGKFCSIGPSVKIGLGKHPFNEFISSHPLFYSNRKQVGFSILTTSKYTEFEEINIGNDVWIGANVIILDGIMIGDGAVIAAGSVVTKDVAPFSLVAGVPAEHKKYKFSEEKIKKIMSKPWWDLNIIEIEKIIKQ